MATGASAITEIKENYLNLCQKRGVEAHGTIFLALQKAAKEFLMSSGNELRIDVSVNRKDMVPKRLSDDDVAILCTVLIDCQLPLFLNLQYNNFTDEGAKFVAKLIQESELIQEINMMCNEITDKGASYIGDALGEAKSLKCLQMNGNKIGDDGGMEMAKALIRSEYLASLDLGDCDLGIDSIIAICSVLQYNENLVALNLSRPLIFSIQEEASVHIGKLLKVNYTLEELHLEKFGIQDFGVRRLCDGLLENKTLTYLNLNSNKMSRDGALAISKLLRINHTLAVLDIGNNRIESAGAKYLSGALIEENRSLTTLVVVNNQIEGDGLVAIADAVENNPTLTNVYIWGNTLSDEACDAFGNLIRGHKLLVSNTDVKPYVVDEQTYLAEMSHGIKKFYYWQPSYGLDYIGRDEDPIYKREERWIYA